MYRFETLRGRLKWAEACLWPVLACNGAMALLQALGILMLGQVVPGAVPGGWPGYERATFAILALAILFGLGAVPAFIRWQRQAARNLHVLTDGPVEYDVGWATWGWFLPFANLLVPMRFFREQAAKSSGGRDEPDLASLVSLWWCLFLGSRLVDRLATRLVDPSDLDSMLAALGLGVVAAGTSVLAGLYAIVLLRRITERQDATWHQLLASGSP